VEIRTNRPAGAEAAAGKVADGRGKFERKSSHTRATVGILSMMPSDTPVPPGDLFPVVYDELRRLAAAQVAGEPVALTLSPTALVHEAYLRLGERPGAPPPAFANRGHFFAAAAEAMRRILIDHARGKLTRKRGGGRRRVPLDEAHRVAESPEGLLALDDALARFAARDPRKAELVKLRFFAGLTTPEAAAALDISVATAERWWAYARTWLFAELSDEEAGSEARP
jgi:RNA polymerase sigma factor (TIGR02999 family)